MRWMTLDWQQTGLAEAICPRLRRAAKRLGQHGSRLQFPNNELMLGAGSGVNRLFGKVKKGRRGRNAFFAFGLLTLLNRLHQLFVHRVGEVMESVQMRSCSRGGGSRLGIPQPLQETRK